MSGPAIPPRNIAREVTEAALESSGWGYFEQQILPLAMSDTFRPADALLTKIALYAQTADGQEFFKWLHEITDRAPYPVGLDGFENMAMAAAAHGARAHVGHLLNKALIEGQRLLDQQPKGAAT